MAAGPPLAAALAAGGLRAVEVTLRTAAAIDAIRAMAADPAVLVGAGTVSRPEQAERAVEAGARFVVSPGFAPAVVAPLPELGVPVVPGVATATEIQMALDAGLDTVKFFPAEQLGGAADDRGARRAVPRRALRAHRRRARRRPATPTSGCRRSSRSAAAGWSPPDLLAGGRWAEVSRRAAAAVAAAEAAVAAGATDASPARVTA